MWIIVIHTYTHIHLHTCTHAHIHTYTHAHMHTCTHAHMHTCTHAHMHACTNIGIEREDGNNSSYIYLKIIFLGFLEIFLLQISSLFRFNFKISEYLPEVSAGGMFHHISIAGEIFPAAVWCCIGPSQYCKDKLGDLDFREYFQNSATIRTYPNAICSLYIVN